MSASTVADLVEKMRELERLGDTEIAHSDADELLVEALRRFGAAELADSFERVPRWYS